MSKTVKRVMRVMMIGLVALLGAKAEAHYYVASGKYKYCSLHGHGYFTGVPDPNLVGPAQVRGEATATLVEISCPNGTLVQSAVNWVLVGQAPIDQSNWKVGGKAHVEVHLGMPEFLLDQLTGRCGVDWTPTPSKVKILVMAEAKICVGPGDPGLPVCPTAASIDTFLDCTIPSGSPRETTYECGTQTIVHYW